MEDNYQIESVCLQNPSVFQVGNDSDRATHFRRNELNKYSPSPHFPDWSIHFKMISIILLAFRNEILLG